MLLAIGGQTRALISATERASTRQLGMLPWALPALGTLASRPCHDTVRP